MVTAIFGDEKIRGLAANMLSIIDENIKGGYPRGSRAYALVQKDSDKFEERCI